MDDEKKSFQQLVIEKRDQALEAVSKVDASKPLAYRISAMVHMAAIGINQKDIAMKFNISPSRVSAVLSSSSARTEIARLQKELFFDNPQEMFKAMLPDAGKTIKRLLSPTQKGSVQLGAAREVFDRSLGKAVQPVEVGGSAIKELLIAIDRKNRAQEDVARGVVSSDITDAEYRQIVNKTEESEDDMDKWLNENDF